MDFKSISISKEGYNIIFIIINRLNKQVIFQSYYKTVTAEDIAWLYIRNIYYY